MRTEEYKIMTINQFADYTSKRYKYSNRLGNLTAEAVGVIKGEKHFPVLRIESYSSLLQNQSHYLHLCLLMRKYSGRG